MTTETWTVSDEYAESRSGDWNVRLNPTQPNLGISLESANHDAWKVFLVNALPTHQLKVEEVYVRQNDLIVRFDQSDSDKFGFQLDYRVLNSIQPNALGIELWLSIQTDDLDSEPILNVVSRAPKGEYWEILNHGAVIQDVNDPNAQAGPAALIAKSTDHSGIWLVESTDQCNAEILSSPGDSEQHLELFGHFMEKGVIRRARLRFHIVTGEVSTEQLKSLYTDFTNSPLPLTA